MNDSLKTAWAAVDSAAARLKGETLQGLFAADSNRFDGLSARFDDLLVDFSKEKLDAEAMKALVSLAEAADVAGRREAMFSGEKINATEGRAVLHTALRDGAGERVVVDGEDVMPEVRAVRERFLAFAEAVRGGAYATVDGAPFTDVVNLGIGGSDLGPAMATLALAPDCDGPRVHYVSNVDGAHLTDTLKGLHPARTLVIVASKTFTTIETMTNAASARAWLAEALGDHAGRHMAAVSTNLEGAGAMGIDPERVFGFWDWVGGRYSIWSAIGLPLATAIGAERFREFLAGAAEIDQHFRTAPLAENLPVLLALIGVWRRNAMGWPTICIAPYDQRLSRFAAYLQQLDMESNGKGTTLAGGAPARETGPVVWGEPGTNSQHSYFQLIHQGPSIIPVDFLLAAEPRVAAENHHALLAANCLAQARALAFGRSEAEVRAEMTAAGVAVEEVDHLAPHRTFPGDRPSTTLLYRRLDARMLGRLIALYEHKVFVQGVIWGVNSFDQWGVELGKALAKELLPAVTGEARDSDGSTLGLLAHFHGLRGAAE